MIQISYEEARQMVFKRFKARGIGDVDWQIRQLSFKQLASGIQTEFQHSQTGKWRKTFLRGYYLPDRPDPSLPLEEWKKARDEMRAAGTLTPEITSK